MSRKLLKEYATLIGNTRLKKDFKICSLEEKKSILRTKSLLEKRIQESLKTLNDKRLYEGTSRIREQHNRVLTEMARYERVCILEAVMDDTANQLFQQASGVVSALIEIEDLAPNVANAAMDKASEMKDMIQTLKDAQDVKSMGGAAKDQMKKIKQVFTDLVVIFKACNAVAEAVSQDDGEIKRDILDQVINWAETAGGKSQALNMKTLGDLFQEYDSAVSVKTPEKKSFFGKFFKKSEPATSGEGKSETRDRFAKKVSEIVKRDAPGAVRMAAELTTGMLEKPLSIVLMRLNSFNDAVGREVDLDLLNKLSTTSWLSSIKSFFGAAGGAGSGSGFRLF